MRLIYRVSLGGDVLNHDASSLTLCFGNFFSVFISIIIYLRYLQVIFQRTRKVSACSVETEEWSPVRSPALAHPPFCLDRTISGDSDATIKASDHQDMVPPATIPDFRPVLTAPESGPEGFF